MSQVTPIADYKSSQSLAPSFASCVTFQAYPGLMPFPETFSMPHGFTFTRLGTSQWFIDVINDLSGLRFDKLGLQIDLSEPKSIVQLVFFASVALGPPIEVVAVDNIGSFVDSAMVPADYVIYIAELAGKDIVSVTVTGGVECYLAQVCAS